jgi:hypothetical protein
MQFSKMYNVHIFLSMDSTNSVPTIDNQQFYAKIFIDFRKNKMTILNWTIQKFANQTKLK